MQDGQTIDTGIIGSGFAGLAAACRWHQNGKNFAILARDFGATQHFSGAFDCIDARLVDASLYGCDFSWSDILTRFCRSHPKHLYAQLFCDLERDVPRFLATLREVVRFYDLPVSGDAETPIWVVGASGLLKPAAFAWASQALTAKEIQSASNVACIGFSGVWEYPMALSVGHLAKIFKAVVGCEFSGVPISAATPYVSLIKGLGNPLIAEDFFKFLKSVLEKHDLVILPPVLSDEMWLQVEQRFSGRVKEMLGILPSWPGLRLQKRVTQILKAKSIFQHTAKIKKFNAVENRIVSAQLENGDDICANNWVLATGKFIGGGVTHKDGEFYESLLRLPLAVGAKAVAAKTHVTRLIDDHAAAEQDVFSLGVAPQEIKKPQNLQVCGHLLTGFDFSRQHCGFGVSVASAYSLDI